jgi:hypothetical protein
MIKINTIFKSFPNLVNQVTYTLNKIILNAKNGTAKKKVRKNTIENLKKEEKKENVHI